MSITILTSISVSLCVFILHLHKLGTRCIPVPKWVNILVTRYIARLVCVTYIIKHKKKGDYFHRNHHDDNDESRPLHSLLTRDELNARYKLIQIDGNGTYILAKDDANGQYMDTKDTKDDINDLHIVHENGSVPMKRRSILIENNSSRHRVDHNEVLWNDVADVLDRFFFWLCFLMVLSFTITMLVVIPLTH